jgi:glycosyltransferase involved in cell wall biosynthesis
VNGRASPRVSICIPCYNGGDYLAPAIESALRQDAVDLEVLVCDNASTDETPSICRGYSDQRFRYVRFENLVCPAANWNRCLDAATGEAVVLLHADDALAPHFLTRALSIMESNREVGLVHCAVQHVDENGRSLFQQRTFQTDTVLEADAAFARLLVRGCEVNPAGVMVRRRVYETVGRFTESVVWGVDWHMWLRIALRYAVAYLAEPLALYRQHQSSGTTAVRSTARNGRDEAWVLRDVVAQVSPDRPHLSELAGEAQRQVAHRTWCMAEDACRLGLNGAARRGLWEAVKIDPYIAVQWRTLALAIATVVGYGWFRRVHRVWSRS